jgi:hypothetical protein
MIYGYARVSTRAQDHTGQIAQPKAAGCVKVFREKITGTTAGRPQLRKVMAGLAHGDVVIPPAVDHLSRDTTDLLMIARNMQRARAGIRSLAEPFVDTMSGFAVGGWRSDRIYPNGLDYKIWWRRSRAQDSEHSIERGLTKHERRAYLSVV